MPEGKFHPNMIVHESSTLYSLTDYNSLMFIPCYRLAACWAQYTSQEEMVKVAEKYNIELTFFHGKGGTVGRGGNPALYRAVLSHPPNTVNGRFRVTEQGEMIRQNFGSPDIAERTLDIYTAAVLRERFIKHVLPSESWRNQMQRISEVSCKDYRQLVRDDPRFVPYFRQATPEMELGILKIGSRPAKRKPKGKITKCSLCCLIM